MLLEIVLVSMVGLAEVAFAAAVFVSVAAPERAPERVLKIPLLWRLFCLLLYSVLCGAVVQLVGVIHRTH